MYTCRECEHPINQATEICPYCGADLSTDQALEELTARPEERHRVLVRRIALWGAMIAAVWGFLWYVLPERTGGAAAAEAESLALVALREARAAVMAFAEAQGKYPVSLEELSGPSFARVREAAQRAQSYGFRIEYMPGPPDPDGRVATFSLLARPGHYGYRNFYSDQTGAVRFNNENRPATAHDKLL